MCLVRALLETRVLLRWGLYMRISGWLCFMKIPNCEYVSSKATLSHLFCTLISENQGLDKSRSVSNLIKISVPVHLIFFSVCHLNFFQVYGTNLKKIQLTNWKKFRSTEKKFRYAGPEIFLRFDTDLNFSQPWLSERKVQIKWPFVTLSWSNLPTKICHTQI